MRSLDDRTTLAGLLQQYELGGRFSPSIPGSLGPRSGRGLGASGGDSPDAGGSDEDAVDDGLPAEHGREDDLATAADESAAGSDAALADSSDGDPEWAEPECIQELLSVEAEDIARLAVATVIDLGPYEYGQLRACVPPGYRASGSADDMMGDYCSRFLESVGISSAAAQRNIDEYSQPATPGLFFTDGHGFMYSAMSLAIMMMHAFADKAVDPTGHSGYDAAELRALIEAGNLHVRCTNDHIITTDMRDGWLRIDPDGKFQTWFWQNSYVGVTYFDRIHVPRGTRVVAAAADYYFWWAHRLWSWSHEGGGLFDFFVGWACAKAALAEVCSLASLLVHEYGHKFMQNGFHCRDLSAGLDCVQYTLAGCFMHGVSAELALPIPHHFDWATLRWRPSEDRFDKGVMDEFTYNDTGVDQVDGGEVLDLLLALGLWAPIMSAWGVLGWVVSIPIILDLYSDAVSGDVSCDGLTLTYTHHDFWIEGRGYILDFTVPLDCSVSGRRVSRRELLG